MADKRYWRFQNVAGKKAELLIYDQIGQGFFVDGVVAKEFVTELRDLGEINELDVRINSPGGNIMEGLAIYNSLRAHAATINVFVDGIAASIASVIAMAGDKITMPPSSLMMIHDPSGMVGGTAEELEKAAEALRKMKATIVAAYEAKTKLTAEALGALMSAETWFTAEEAVAEGFADTIGGEVEAVNLARFEPANHGWRNPPLELIAACINAVPAPVSTSTPSIETENDMDLEELKTKHPALFAQAKELGAEEADIGPVKAAASEKERHRINDILALGTDLGNIEGLDALLQKLAFEDKATVEQATAEVLAFVKGNMPTARMGADLLDDGQQPASSGAGAGDDGGGTIQTFNYSDATPLDEQVKAAWRANAIFGPTGRRVKDEFIDAAGMEAFIEAEQQGLVKILTGTGSK